MTAYLVRGHKHGVVEDPREYAKREQLMLKDDVVILPYDQVADLSSVASGEGMKALFRETYQLEPNAADNLASQAWWFCHHMGHGDIIVLPFYRFKERVAVGKVVGGYEYRSDLGEPGLHTRSVKWLTKHMPLAEFAEDVRGPLRGAPKDFCRIKSGAPEVEPHIREVVQKWLEQTSGGE